MVKSPPPWNLSRIPKMMKLGSYTLPKEDLKKYINCVTHILKFCWHQHFFNGNQQILLYQEIEMQIAFWHIISNFLNVPWVCKDCFNMVTILMMSAKMATVGLLKMKLFWNKGYDFIIYVHDITNKIISRDLNYIADVVIWLKFDNSSISMTEVIITSIL